MTGNVFPLSCPYKLLAETYNAADSQTNEYC